MKTHQMFIGDENGLRDCDVELAPVLPKKNVGPDPEFVAELIQRRKALGVTAVLLSETAGFSRAYVSGIENGHFHASHETKARIREALRLMENGV